MQKNLIDDYLDRVRNLPPAPTVAVQLLNEFSDPDRDIDRIVEIISHDPSLTAETLKRCNHSGLSSSDPVADMFTAVLHLGLYEVYSIVVSLIASRTMKEVRAKSDWESNRLWQHTVTTAVIASVVGSRLQVVEATAFTAGLLHDIGKLVLFSTEGVAYAQMARNSGFFGPALVAAEESAMGFPHANLGAHLLARWGLPENICTAVKWHHQTPVAGTPHLRLIATVNFANRLAHRMTDGPADTPIAAVIPPELMGLVELTADEMPAIEQEIQEALEQVQGLLQLNA